jgi:predicted Zn-dependent protease
MYEEAHVIFEDSYSRYENSFTLLNYGITLIFSKKPDYQIALSILSRANLLNPYNPDIWGYLVISSLHLEKVLQAFQARKEALKLKLVNVELLQQISALWLK